jgi:hypothetical protein
MLNSEESVLTIDKNGTKRWRNKNGELHRVGGPAIEYSDGNKSWYQNGLCHRIDGPAFEYTDGSKLWYLAGKFFENKEDLFDALTDEEKEIALFSEDFHNG